MNLQKFSLCDSTVKTVIFSAPAVASVARNLAGALLQLKGTIK